MILRKLLNNAAYRKFSGNVRKRLRLEILEKNDIKNTIKQQSKLTFNGIHKPYENYDSYTFNQNQVVMDKAVYVGFAILELSKLHMYEIYYDKLQPYFGLEKLQLHYIDTDGMVLSIKKNKILSMIYKTWKILLISVIWMKIMNFIMMKTKSNRYF